jgi:regulator of sigma E protease
MNSFVDAFGSGLWALVAFAVLLGAIIAVHEWGHFFVARRCGVQVIRFSIGFGRPLWSRVGNDGTEYVVAAIPLGGYVKMLDEREAPVPEAQLHRAFNRKPVAQRFAIVAAGPVVNLLFAVLLYWLLFVVGTQQLAPVIGSVAKASVAERAGLRAGDEVLAIDGVTVRSWEDIPLRLAARVGESGQILFRVRSGAAGLEREVPVPVDAFMHGREDGSPSADIGVSPWLPEVPPVVGRVVETIDSDAGRIAGPAAQAGLRPGDRILRVDGLTVTDWSDWVEAVRASPAIEMQVEIERDGRVLTLALTPAATTRDGSTIGAVGLVMQSLRWPRDWPEEYVREVRYGPLESVARAVAQTWDRSVLTLESIAKMATGMMSVQSVGGPISIAKGAGATASLGPEVFLGFMAFLSISIGLLNLLPIPVLDGGHLVFYVIEAVRGKPLPERVQLVALNIGVALLLALMSLAIFNDVMRVLE